MARCSWSQRGSLQVRRCVRGAKYGDGNPWVEAEYNEILAVVKADQQIEAAGWVRLLQASQQDPLPHSLGMTLQAGQQFTGANYFFYFGTAIFNQSDSTTLS